MFLGVHLRSIQEASEILEFANGLCAMTGEAPVQCLELVISIPPSYRIDAMQAVSEGMTLEEVETIFWGTFLSASWRFNLACRDLCRAVVGAPTVKAQLTPDELGFLTEIDTP